MFEVAAILPVELIGSVPKVPVQIVIPVFAIDEIVARLSMNRVIAICALDRVGIGHTNYRVIIVRALNDHHLLPRP